MILLEKYLALFLSTEENNALLIGNLKSSKLKNNISLSVWVGSRIWIQLEQNNGRGGVIKDTYLHHKSLYI